VEVASVGTIIEANTLGNPSDIKAPFANLKDAWNGQKTFFDVHQPLEFGRIDGGQTKSGVGDVEIGLGYVFINNEYNFWTLDLRAIFPTGNRPTGKFLFEPIIGNGHQFEIGAGTLASLELWNNKCDKSLSFFINGSLYYAFAGNQKRTFDLTKNGVGSRYLLFKRFNPDGTYAGEIVRGPNILTLACESSNAIHGDFTLMLDFDAINWTLNIGYNIWGRSHDQVKVKESIPANTYGIAGLSGTAANANTTASGTTLSGENATMLDPAPVFIGNKDLNVESAEHPGAVSHSLFAFGAYTWGCRLEPFVGLGFQLEFSGSDNNAFRRYTVFARGGISLF
jgi:hypothetical protein